jgi:MoxR-like ATPase
MRECLASVVLVQEIVKYIVDVIRATRDHPAILLGAGPRATQSLTLATRACAAMDGRDFVTPDDIRSMASSVLEHRMILRPEAEVEGVTTNEILEQIFSSIAVPR